MSMLTLATDRCLLAVLLLWPGVKNEFQAKHEAIVYDDVAALTLEYQGDGRLEVTDVTVACEADCRIALERMSPGVTATRGKIRAIRAHRLPRARVYFNSNAQIGDVFLVDEAGPKRDYQLPPKLVSLHAGQDLTVRVGPTTGRVSVSITWKE